MLARGLARDEKICIAQVSLRNYLPREGFGYPSLSYRTWPSPSRVLEETALKFSPARQAGPGKLLEVRHPFKIICRAEVPDHLAQISLTRSVRFLEEDP